tara:strand:+ start:64 stop:867 length:804 start_codon:yes stop_codon:yes gene_type:complete
MAMLSYQHIYHAGCLADVHKHAALCLLLNQMVQKDKPLSYVETHAGRGLYDLQSPESQKTGEAAAGIERVLKDKLFSNDHIYTKTLNAVKAKHGDHIYAGSPALAQEVLRDYDRIHLSELHPQEFDHLRHSMRGRNIKSYKRNGYETLRAISPCDPRRGFVFIDPSFEIKSEYGEIISHVKHVHRVWNVAVICVWYPLLPSGAHHEMIEGLQALDLPKTMVNEVEFYTQNGQSRGMYGSGLFIANLPYGVEDNLNAMTALLSMKGSV